MGMKAAIITNSEPIANLGENLGFMLNNSKVGLHFSEPHVSNSVPQLASSAQVASELLELLGLGSQPLKESNNCELVLVHVTAGSGTDDAVARSCIDWIDSIVGEVKNLMQPGTKADDHLYLTLVFSYGVKAASDVSLNNLELHRQQVFDSLQTNLRVHCPQQSYKMKDGKLVIDVRDHHPMLVVHQMNGVTRRDHVSSLDFDDFLKNGCNLSILADRFLHELAFKLWKAPKYGA
ncbi:hypothetical protein KP509_14G061100 [Ceratopteris richardii]|nr:hypothetical protein KP509_14G061100 [Ceratopteris richardii]